MKRLIMTALLVCALLLPASGALARYETVEKENGTYYGHTQDGKYNGFGIFFFKDGTIYAGMFKDSLYEGMGVYLYPEGHDFAQLSGFFHAGKSHGESATLLNDGKGTRTSGRIEQGAWVSGTTNTTVNEYESKRLQFADGFYVGEVVYGTDIPYGYGCMEIDDGTVHMGWFRLGIPNGPGVQMKADRTYFIGEWDAGVLISVDECEGLTPDAAWATAWPGLLKEAPAVDDIHQLDQGQDQEPDGKEEQTQTGDLAPNALEEYTTIRIENGEYIGNVVNGQSNGYGGYLDDDGAQYIGMFKDNRFHGLGLYIYPEDHPEGIIHQAGMFENGELNGEGAMLLRDADSTRMIGEWANGQIIPGMGQYSILKYEWKSMTLVPGVYYIGEVAYGSDTPMGYGLLIREDETTYLGQFDMGVPCGMGVQENPDYSYIVGEWLYGTLTKVIESSGYAGDPAEADWSGLYADEPGLSSTQEVAVQTPAPTPLPTQAPTPAPTPIPATEPPAGQNQAGGGRELPGGSAPAPTVAASEYYMVIEASDGNTYVYEEYSGSYWDLDGTPYIVVSFSQPHTDPFWHDSYKSSRYVNLSIPIVKTGTVLTTENVGQFTFIPYYISYEIPGLMRGEIETDIEVASNGDFVNKLKSWEERRFRIAFDSVSDGVHTGTIEVWKEADGFTSAPPPSFTGSFRFLVK